MHSAGLWQRWQQGTSPEHFNLRRRHRSQALGVLLPAPFISSYRRKDGICRMLLVHEDPLGEDVEFIGPS